MNHGLDARQVCGRDIRSYGVWPSDSARLDAFIGQHGGVLEAYPVNGVGVTLRWLSGDRVVTETGTTAGDALRRLQAAIVEVS